MVLPDGNGRIGRAIILKQCLDCNILPVIIFSDDRMRYYHALHLAQIEGNYQVLFDFFVEEQSKYWKQVEPFLIEEKNF